MLDLFLSALFWKCVYLFPRGNITHPTDINNADTSQCLVNVTIHTLLSAIIEMCELFAVVSLLRASRIVFKRPEHFTTLFRSFAADENLNESFSVDDNV